MAEDPDQPQKTKREDLQTDHDESVNPLLVPDGLDAKPNDGADSGDAES